MSNVFEGTRFCIHTFGCQMNKHDSERVAGMLEGLGSLPVETIEEADIAVFMTCCVREAADTRLYGQVASMKNIPLRDGTPLDKRYIAVGGCIGQRDGDKLLAALPHLDVVFGTHNLGSLPGLLRCAIEQHGRAAGGAANTPVGCLSDRTVCDSRWRGLAPTSSIFMQRKAGCANGVQKVCSRFPI